MSGRQILHGVALGTGLWFLAVVYFVVLVQAVIPDAAGRMREMASAGFLPMALISALVLVRQGRVVELGRSVLALAGGVLIWLPAAALVRWGVVGPLPSPIWIRLLPAVDLALLVGAFAFSWRFTGRLLRRHRPTSSLPRT
ncbi:MAG: hypothetical protein EA422_00810 [Gemmatimonadales bacterium]|nr:MAG: hypothetical protein EA422_00810 [Gemmatimonadales bacterium]